MRLALTILACLAIFRIGGAIADDECFAPMADWKPRDAVAALAARQGWTIHRIKIDDGCYRIIGTDAEGRQIAATVHPSTLEILDVGRKDADGHGSRKGKDRHGAVMPRFLTAG